MSTPVTLLLSALIVALLAGCAGMPPGADTRPPPVEHVVVVAQFDPRFEWDDRRQYGANFMGMVPYSIACGPLVVVCLPAAVIIGGLATAVSVTVSYATRPKESNPVRAIDSTRLGHVQVQSRLQALLAEAGWSAPEVGGGKSRTLRLEATVDRVKSINDSPIGNLWWVSVAELDLSWRLVDPADSSFYGTVAGGSFRLEKQGYALPLRFDEASRRWVREDSGDYAADWERVTSYIVSRIAEQAIPAIAAYSRNPA